MQNSINPFDSISNQLSKIELLIKDLQQPQIEKRDSEKLMNVSDAAKFLNLSKQTIYTKVHLGEIPVMKRSKKLYFSESELLDYIKEGKRKTYNELLKEGGAIWYR